MIAANYARKSADQNITDEGKSHRPPGAVIVPLAGVTRAH